MCRMISTAEAQQSSKQQSETPGKMSPATDAGLKRQSSNDPLDLSLSKVLSGGSGQKNQSAEQHLGKLGKALKAANQANKQTPVTTQSSAISSLAAVKLASPANDATVEGQQNVHIEGSDNLHAQKSSNDGNASTQLASTPTIFDPEFSIARTKSPRIELHVIVPPSPVNITSGFKVPIIPASPSGVKSPLPPVSIIVPPLSLPPIATLSRRTRIFKPAAMQSLINKQKLSEETKAVDATVSVSVTTHTNSVTSITTSLTSDEPAIKRSRLTEGMTILGSSEEVPVGNIMSHRVKDRCGSQGGRQSVSQSANIATEVTHSLSGGKDAPTSTDTSHGYSQAYSILSEPPTVIEESDDQWERASGRSYYEMVTAEEEVGGVGDADKMDVDELRAHGYLETYTVTSSPETPDYFTSGMVLDPYLKKITFFEIPAGKTDKLVSYCL